MQEKSGHFPTWGYLLLGALAFTAFCFIKYMGQQTLMKLVLGKPAELVSTAMNSAKISPRITSKTGIITARSFKVEKFNSKGDSLAFRFLLKGEFSAATIKLWMIKRPSGEWKIVKSDTVFTK